MREFDSLVAAKKYLRMHMRGDILELKEALKEIAKISEEKAPRHKWRARR
jgi:pyrroloquinoline quinone (PQQ) biosynthesis protein C